MPDVTLGQALGNATIRPILQTWAKRYNLDDQVEFLLDVRVKKPTKYLYETYIALGAPKLLKVDAAVLKPIRDQAAQLPPDYAGMTKTIAEAAAEVAKAVNVVFTNSRSGFEDGVDYMTYRMNSINSTPLRAATELKLKGPKRDKFVALMTVYLKPRGIEDAHAAYVGMQKLANKAKLDSILTHSGKPSGPVETQYQASKLTASIRKGQAEAVRYLDTAIATVKSKGKPASPAEVNRMFNSGRERVEDANTPYVKAVRIDKTFATKNPTLAAEKKKIDELWADYRKLLGQ